ncbi:36735_t:CDS:2, partial [Gigaspora margarita]
MWHRKKNLSSIVKSNDLNTQDIGRELADKLMLHFKGMRPYLVINHLGRSKIDVNRPIKEDRLCSSAETLSLPTPQINENPDIYSGSSIHSLYTRKSNNIQFADLLY